MGTFVPREKISKRHSALLCHGDSDPFRCLDIYIPGFHQQLPIFSGKDWITYRRYDDALCGLTADLAAREKLTVSETPDRPPISERLG